MPKSSQEVPEFFIGDKVLVNFGGGCLAEGEVVLLDYRGRISEAVVYVPTKSHSAGEMIRECLKDKTIEYSSHCFHDNKTRLQLVRRGKDADDSIYSLLEELS